MTALCPCGQPVAFNVRRAHSWGTGPWERVCADCAPSPALCVEWHDFYNTAAKSAEVVAEVRGAAA